MNSDFLEYLDLARDSTIEALRPADGDVGPGPPPETPEKGGSIKRRSVLSVHFSKPAVCPRPYVLRG